MGTSSHRILLIDDYEPWRRFERMTLLAQQGLQIVGEAVDGEEAIRKADELKPDLILLDISLSTSNGIAVARGIRRVSPDSKILFVSENRSPDIAEEALNTGAQGYVVKSDAARELLPAIKAVLEGKRFISRSLSVPGFRAALSDRSASITHRHEVTFYADEISLLEGYARCIESALKDGNAVIILLTELHRASLLAKLEAGGVDVAAAIERGSYITLDAVDAITTLSVNDMPDPRICEKVIGDVVTRAAKGARGEHARVIACGEIAPTMLAKGNPEGAIQLEQIWDKIARKYGVHTHCGYVWNASPDRESSLIFERICAEHTAVHTVN